jgi:hypothetical protein
LKRSTDVERSVLVLSFDIRPLYRPLRLLSFGDNTHGALNLGYKTSRKALLPLEARIESFQRLHRHTTLYLFDEKGCDLMGEVGRLTFTFCKLSTLLVSAVLSGISLRFLIE